jgi:hypothetical protein
VSWFSFNGHIYMESDMVRQEAWRKDLPRRSLAQIAAEIRKDWGSKVNYAAKPYLAAMADLDKITDEYGCDSGKSIVVYFLGNANSWRGETARRIKAELKGML